MTKTVDPQIELNEALRTMNNFFKQAQRHITNKKYELAEEAFIKAQSFDMQKLETYHNNINRIAGIIPSDESWPEIQKLSIEIEKEYDEFKITLPFMRVLKDMNLELDKARDFIKKKEYDLAKNVFNKVAHRDYFKNLGYLELGDSFDLTKEYWYVHYENNKPSPKDAIYIEIRKLSKEIKNDSSLFDQLESLRSAKLPKLENTNDASSDILSTYNKELASLTDRINTAKESNFKTIEADDTIKNYIEDSIKHAEAVQGEILVAKAYEQFNQKFRSFLGNQNFDQQGALEIVQSAKECKNTLRDLKNQYQTIDIEQYENQITQSFQSLEQPFASNLKEKEALFFDALAVLSKQLIILGGKAKADPKTYQNVVDNALSMHYTLSECGKIFFDQTTTLDNLEERYKDFKEKCKTCINDYSEAGKFQEHRILSQTTAKIWNVVLALPLFALSVLSTIKHGEWRSSFFNTGKTATHKAVDEVQEKLTLI